MEKKFLLWSRTIWGMALLNGAIAAWQYFAGHQHTINPTEVGFIEMAGTALLRLITTQPVTLVPSVPPVVKSLMQK
jgi:hypothetical protein